MIVIHPIKNENNMDLSDANYTLADLIRNYAIQRNGEVTLSRKSNDAPDIPPETTKLTVDPDILIQIDIGSDAPDGDYLISCDAFTALVGTLNNTLNTYIGNPSNNGSGIKVENLQEPKFSKANDIVIYLKNIPEDIDALARHIVEGMYWYAIRSLSVEDDTNNNDPYLYRFTSLDTWSEEESVFKSGQEYNKSTGCIKEENPDAQTTIRYLNIHSETTGIYDRDIDQENSIPESEPGAGDGTTVYLPDINQHYTWRIKTEQLTSDYTLLFNTRTTGDTPCTLYVKVGPISAPFNRYTPNYVEYKQEISSKDFIKVEVPISGVIISSIEIGVEGSGDIDITAVWLTNHSDQYQLLPQGFRTSIKQEKQEEIPSSPIQALTSGNTPETRVKDRISPPLPEEEPIPPEPPSAAGDAPVASEAGFNNIMGGALSQLTSGGGLLDTTQLANIDLSAMTAQIKSLSSVADKLKFSKGADKINSIKTAATQQVEAVSSLAEKAKDGAKQAVLNNTKKAMEAGAKAKEGLENKKKELKEAQAQQAKAVGDIADKAKKAKEAATNSVNTAKNTAASVKEKTATAIDSAKSATTNTANASLNAKPVNNGKG